MVVLSVRVMYELPPAPPAAEHRLTTDLLIHIPHGLWVAQDGGVVGDFRKLASVHAPWKGGWMTVRKCSGGVQWMFGC